VKALSEFARLLMKFESMPDMLEVNQTSDGLLIAVGMPWDAGVFIQEYWLAEDVYYAIANRRDDAIEISVAEWKGGVGERLMKPWVIASNTVSHLKVNNLLNDYSGSLVAISLNDNPVHGLLRTPQPLPEFIAPAPLERILTIEGLNGTGDRNTKIWCLQPRVLDETDQTILLSLHVPAQTGTIFFRKRGTPDHLPMCSVIKARSETLSVEEHDDVFIIGTHEIPDVRFHEAALEVKAPDISRERMVAISGRVLCRGGAGFSLARGIIAAA
jgi:hypothetical protein